MMRVTTTARFLRRGRELLGVSRHCRTQGPFATATMCGAIQCQQIRCQQSSSSAAEMEAPSGQPAVGGPTTASVVRAPMSNPGTDVRPLGNQQTHLVNTESSSAKKGYVPAPQPLQFVLAVSPKAKAGGGIAATTSTESPPLGNVLGLELHLRSGSVELTSIEKDSPAHRALLSCGEMNPEDKALLARTMVGDGEREERGFSVRLIAVNSIPIVSPAAQLGFFFSLGVVLALRFDLVTECNSRGELAPGRPQPPAAVECPTEKRILELKGMLSRHFRKVLSAQNGSGGGLHPLDDLTHVSSPLHLGGKLAGRLLTRRKRIANYKRSDMGKETVTGCRVDLDFHREHPRLAISYEGAAMKQAGDLFTHTFVPDLARCDPDAIQLFDQLAPEEWRKVLIRSYAITEAELTESGDLDLVLVLTKTTPPKPSPRALSHLKRFLTEHGHSSPAPPQARRFTIKIFVKSPFVSVCGKKRIVDLCCADDGDEMDGNSEGEEGSGRGYCFEDNFSFSSVSVEGSSPRMVIDNSKQFMSHVANLDLHSMRQLLRQYRIVKAGKGTPSGTFSAPESLLVELHRIT